jgi:pimeloyl-ACP methyl ester carboxylesterase
MGGSDEAERNDDIGQPRLNPLLILGESRSMFEAATLVPGAALLARAPRGDGHPVIVIPPFGAGDFLTTVARRFFGLLGYEVHRWGRKEVLGLHRLATVAVGRLEEIHRSSGRKVTLVGHSLGGIYAREIARYAPDMVRSVVTVGSPFAGDLKSNYVWPMYESITGTRIAGLPSEFVEKMNQPPPVPSTAIYSRSDGVASWQSCVERTGPMAENVEVQGSHIGLLHNPLVLYLIADRLAEPEGSWKPFDRAGWRARVYGERLRP